MSKTDLQILVPRLIDADNFNAQNLNARAMLARFDIPGVTWHVFCYGEPDATIAGRPGIHCHRLRHGRLWPWHAVALYQGAWDAIFYPGNEWFDRLALRLRRWTFRRIPVLATMEGVPGDAAREALLSQHFGREIHCFRPRSGSAWTACHDEVRSLSDHIVAISPYLQEVASVLYGKPGAVCPLGVELASFHAHGRSDPAASRLVLGAGTLYEAKRPQLFIELARRNPAAEFLWYGDGPMRASLLHDCRSQGITNLDFPGAASAAELAAGLRRARLFVLPSLSEGVPKVTQEAAACGVPVIAFAHYASPVVVDGVNGHAVQSIAELYERVGQLLASADATRKLGAAGAAMAVNWDWDHVAGQWQRLLKSWFDPLRGG